MSIEEQINELNSEVKCHIAPSPIHGVGVFALIGLKQGEKLHCIPNKTRRWYTVPFERLDELRPEIKRVVLARWPSIINGSMFQSPNDDVWLASFINHSDNPNYEQSSDSALRDIAAGEEVVEDYRVMKNSKEIYDFL